MDDNRLADRECVGLKSRAEFGVTGELDDLFANHESSTVGHDLLDLASQSGMDLDGRCDEAVLGLHGANPDELADGEPLSIEAAVGTKMLLGFLVSSLELLRQSDFETIHAETIQLHHGSEDAGSPDAAFGIVA
jgi:hypothetical protein